MCSVEQTQASSTDWGIRIVSSACRPACRNQTTQCKWNSTHIVTSSCKLQQCGVHNTSAWGRGGALRSESPSRPTPAGRVPLSIQSVCMLICHSILRRWAECIGDLLRSSSTAHTCRINATPDGEERSRGACSRASRSRRRHTLLAKVVSWKRKARATAEECFFALWPLLLLRTCPRKMAARWLARLLSCVELFYNLD